MSQQLVNSKMQTAIIRGKSCGMSRDDLASLFDKLLDEHHPREDLGLGSVEVDAAPVTEVVETVTEDAEVGQIIDEEV